MFRLLHKGLFYLLVLLVPVNLAKNFISPNSYVSGVLVDYLIPSIYLTDILVLATLALWVVDEFLRLYLFHNFSFKSYALTFKSFFNRRVVIIGYLLLMFILSLLFATDFSFAPSFYKFGRYLLFSLLAVYTYFNYSNKDDFNKISTLLASSALFQSFISLVQWVNGRSFFNNYLFFGEQPFTYKTPGLVYKDYFGELKLAPYGTFPHPNVLSGFLVFVLLVLLMYTFKKGLKPLVVCAWLYSLIILLLTKGSVAIFGFLLGIAFFGLYIGLRFLVVKYVAKGSHSVKEAAVGKLRAALLIVVVLFFVLINALSVYSAVNMGFGSKSHSVYRRVDLINASLKMFGSHPLSGVGLNKFTLELNNNGGVRGVIRFIQPVHNIFFLILSECGVVSLTLFCMLLVSCFYYFSRPRVFLYFVLLFVIVFISNFDHYFLTLQQGQLLFWLTLGMGASTIKQDAEIEKSKPKI